MTRSQWFWASVSAWFFIVVALATIVYLAFGG